MIIFSQGSVCLKKIPLSLRTLFRKTSVQLPDMETLLCGILRSPLIRSKVALTFSSPRVKSLKKPVTMSRNLVRSVTNIYKLLTNPVHSKANIYR